jgi:hypothetical protein
MAKDKTYIDDLAEYVKKNLKKGYTAESLKWALVKQGHAKIEVDKSIKKAEQDLAISAPVLQTKPEIKYEAEPVVPEQKKSFWKRMFGIE